jgi:hypothetical protein
MTSPGTYWGSDVPISMPEATDDPAIINLGAHGIGVNGLVHNFNSGDAEQYLPTFTPEILHNG